LLKQGQDKDNNYQDRGALDGLGRRFDRLAWFRI